MPAISGSIPVTGFVAPTDSADTYAAHHETYGKGGYRTVADTTERDAIPTGRRKEGMRVYVISNGTEYMLGSGLTNSDWTVTKNGARIVTSWASLSGMAAAGIPNGTEFFAQSRAAIGDGGEGMYWYDSSSSITAIPGLVIAPASGGGRFLRHYGNVIDPARDMGADNTGTTDSTTILQAAIDFASDPTYGWAMSAGSEGKLGLGVGLLGAFTISSTLTLRGAVDLHGVKRGSRANDYSQYALISNKHGGHCLMYDLKTDEASGNFRSPSIRNINFTGYSETYQQNKKDIAVVTSRTVFEVASADAPAGLDLIPEYAANNTCFFFDDQGAYLGSGRIASIGTSGSNKVITLEAGTDAYSSINGTSGGKLTTSCKVVFAPLITEESNLGITDFYDPASAGSCAIFLKNTTTSRLGALPLIENVYINRFHCGIRFGPRGVGGSFFSDISVQFCKFAGIAWPRTPNVTDHFFNGSTYVSGYYRADFGATGRTNTIDTPALQYCTYGLFGIPAVSKWDRALIEECAFANVYLQRVINAQMNHLFCDGVIGYGILVGPGYYGYSAPSTPYLSNSISIGSLFLKNQLEGYPVDTVHATSPVGIKWEDNTATVRSTFLYVGDLKVVKSSDTSGLIPIFAHIADLGTRAGNNNRLRVGVLSERNGATLLSKSGTKEIEFDDKSATTAAEVYTGWYWDGTKRAFAVAASDVFSMASTGITAGSTSFTGTPITSTVGNATTLARLSRSSGSPQNYDIKLSTGAIKFTDADTSLDTQTMFANSSQIQLWMGSNLGNSSAARSSNLYSESRTGGTDLAPSNLNIVAPAGTGNASSNGAIGFYTADPGSSGTTAQTVTLKLQLQRSGQLRLVGITPTSTGEGDVWFNTTNGFRQYFAAGERPLAPKRIGSSTLVGGTVTVFTSSAKSTSLLYMSVKTIGGTVGTLSYTISDGVSFTINSSSGTDTSTVNWQLWEP